MIGEYNNHPVHELNRYFEAETQRNSCMNMLELISSVAFAALSAISFMLAVWTFSAPASFFIACSFSLIGSAACLHSLSSALRMFDRHFPHLPIRQERPNRIEVDSPERPEGYPRRTRVYVGRAVLNELSENKETLVSVEEPKEAPAETPAVSVNKYGPAEEELEAAGEKSSGPEEETGEGDTGLGSVAGAVVAHQPEAEDLPSEAKNERAVFKKPTLDIEGVLGPTVSEIATPKTDISPPKEVATQTNISSWAFLGLGSKQESKKKE
jgi:hypothetical protein